MKERFKAILSVYALFRKDGEILLSRRYQTGYMDGYFSLPAGHVEEGESIRQGFLREMKEEVGVRVDWGSCRLAHVRSRNSDCHRADFFFTVDKWEGELVNAEPDKCDQIRWFSKDALPDMTIPYIADSLHAIEKGIMYSEDGWSENFSSMENVL